MTLTAPAPPAPRKPPREHDPRNPVHRLPALLDEGSVTFLGPDDGSGMRAATGTVHGRPVVAFCSDVTVMGGAMGAVLGGWLPAADPGFWALLAMAATMGGTMRAPLTATFFAVELTGDAGALLPLMAACSTAHLVTVLLMKRSILTEKIARRGHHIVREYRVDPFVLTRVDEVMTRNVQTVPASMTLQGAVSFLTAPERHHPSFPVVDEDGRVLGIIDPPSVMNWRRSGKHRKATLGELLSGTRILVADPDEYLESLAEKMMKANVAHMPVVDPESGALVGYIGWKDLMQARQKVRTEDQDRAAFLSVPRHRKAAEE